MSRKREDVTTGELFWMVAVVALGTIIGISSMLLFSLFYDLLF